MKRKDLICVWVNLKCVTITAKLSRCPKLMCFAIQKCVILFAMQPLRLVENLSAPCNFTNNSDEIDTHVCECVFVRALGQISIRTPYTQSRKMKTFVFVKKPLLAIQTSSAFIGPMPVLVALSLIINRKMQTIEIDNFNNDARCGKTKLLFGNFELFRKL